MRFSMKWNIGLLSLYHDLAMLAVCSSLNFPPCLLPAATLVVPVLFFLRANMLKYTIFYGCVTLNHPFIKLTNRFSIDGFF